MLADPAMPRLGSAVRNRSRDDKFGTTVASTMRSKNGRAGDHRLITGSQANIDHVVIGPAGICVVETKRYTGKLIIRGGELYVAGRRQTKSIDQVASRSRRCQPGAGRRRGVR